MGHHDTDRSSFRFILYDLDGTLVDSVPLGIELFRVTAEQMSLPVPTAAALRRWWGFSTPEIVNEFWPHIALEKFNAVLRDNALSAKAYETIPGATETVKQLRSMGKRDGIFTNRRRGDGLRTVLAAIGLPYESWTFLFSPEDEHSSKSDPRALESLLFKIVERHGIPTSEVLFVGDTILDAKIALINGVPFAGVLTGAASAEDFIGEGIPASSILPSVVDLVAWLHPI